MIIEQMEWLDLPLTLVRLETGSLTSWRETAATGSSMGGPYGFRRPWPIDRIEKPWSSAARCFVHDRSLDDDGADKHCRHDRRFNRRCSSAVKPAQSRALDKH
jgi:hypothetical protein